MKYYMSLSVVVLTGICAVLLSGLKAQEIKVMPKVWASVGQEEVTLSCQFTHATKEAQVNQVQWSFQRSDSETLQLVVFNEKFGTVIHEKYEGRLDMREFSLVIRNVILSDAGVYTCALSTFPSGSFLGRTTLLVDEQMPLTAGSVAAIVIIGVVLLGVITASTSFIVFRRNHISIDTQNAEMDPFRPSLIKREDLGAEVVYAHVELRPTASQIHGKTSDDCVTYSEVKVMTKKPDRETYTQVMQI